MCYNLLRHFNYMNKRQRQFVVIDQQRNYRSDEDKIFQFRFLAGISNIVNHVFKDDAKALQEFEDLHHAIYVSLDEALLAADMSIQIMEEITQRLKDQSEESLKTGQININTPPELNLFVKDFFIRGNIATDFLANRLAPYLGFNISFLFGREDKKFNDQLALFKKENPYQVVTDYLIPKILKEREMWVNEFCIVRNKIEHAGFQLPRTKAFIDKREIRPLFYEIQEGTPLSDSLRAIWKSLFELCEDIIVLLLATKLKGYMCLACLSEKERDPQMPLRFKLVPHPELMKKITDHIAKERGSIE